MTPLGIMIADDHQLVIDGLRLMIEAEEDLRYVGQANDGLSLLDQLAHTPADIVLLDINMPVRNGVETCRLLQERFPQVKAIALSMVSEASLVRLMLKYGARGYLLKNAGRAEVLQAIRRVGRGETYYSPDILEAVLAGDPGRAAPDQHPFPQLSRREKQVLQLIIAEHTTSEIADKLFISAGTVETHRRNLLIKLGTRNTAGLVRICLEYNLLG